MPADWITGSQKQSPISSWLRRSSSSTRPSWIGASTVFTSPITSASDSGGAGINNSSYAVAGSTGNSMLDQANQYINQAASKYGVPANLIKAMINRESSGNWGRDGSRLVNLRGDTILPYVGIFFKTAVSWGYNPQDLVGNQSLQIDAMANGLSRIWNYSDPAGSGKKLGDVYGWDGVIKMYFGGEQAVLGTFTDENGLNSGDYYNRTINEWKAWDQQSGVSSNWGAPGSGGGGTNTANAVLKEAQKYIGVSYVWGSIPGANQDPWKTGWDCSGFTWFLDQKYGNKTLPQGSHYQYDYAVRSGKLNTNINQLKPGDLVFFDTMDSAPNGAGANMNRASHVAIYMGNGKIMHAASGDLGTIISDMNSSYYSGRFLGGMSMSWSGGGPISSSPGAGPSPGVNNFGSYMSYMSQLYGRNNR